MNNTRPTILLGLSLIGGCSFYYNKISSKVQKEMILFNNWPFHDEVLRYICMKYADNINSFNYSVEKVYHFNEWRRNRIPNLLNTLAIIAR